MSIQANAIKEIVKLTIDAQFGKITQLPGDPPWVRHMLKPGGELVQLPDAQPRGWTSGHETLDSFCEFVAANNPKDYVPDIFVSKNLVVWHKDKEFQHSGAYVSMTQHEQFGQLMKWGNVTPGYAQKEFINLLNITLRGTLTSTEIIGLLKTLRWSKQQSANAAFAHGKETLGRAVDVEVHGEQSIPEEINLSVPIYGNVEGIYASLTAFVVIDADAMNFQLRFVPGAVARQALNAVSSVARQIEYKFQQLKTEANVYLGDVADPNNE